MIQRLGEHAAVIGGSIAGLLAARVLCRHFERVTIFEQDPLDGNRPGVPQSSQTHVLLPAGARVLERLFPGRLAEMVRDGAHQFDYGESRFHLIGNWMPRVETGLMTLAQTRPFLESHIRRWVNEIPNVRLASGSRVAKLLFNDARTRVRGVSLAGRAVGADLIIDAAGRNSRLPLWLGGVVPETTLKINLGYTTGKFRVPASMSPDHPILYVVGRPPGLRRFGSICGVERDGANIIVCGALGGYHGDHPPGDPDGFLAFAKSLHEPLVHDILSQSELIEPLARYAIPAAVRRHYDRLERMPDGVLPIGDAACCFDPAFAQGMSVAALEAEALDDCLNRATGLGSRLTRDYLKRLDAVIATPWKLACGEDLKYPQTQGRRSLGFHLARPYRDRLATCGDMAVTREFYRVLALTAPPAVLLHPRIVFRALLPEGWRIPYNQSGAISNPDSR